MLQRYNKKINTSTITKDFFFFTSLVNRFYLLECWGTYIFALILLKLKDYLELNKKEEKHEEKNDFSGCDGCHGYGFKGTGQSGVAKWGRVECEDCAERGDEHSVSVSW